MLRLQTQSPMLRIRIPRRPLQRPIQIIPRIQLHARLRDISMIDMSKIPHDRVGLGSIVVVLDVDKDEKVRYKLVTSEDVDVANGLISTVSPIGRGLLGKQVGDTVRITIPGGVREMEVIELSTIHQIAENLKAAAPAADGDK